MMFEKDNTNFNGECLCASCVFSVASGNGQYRCIIDHKTRQNVGVCKDYEAFKSDRYGSRD